MTENQITASEIARRLSGIEYPCRVALDVLKAAKDSGIVIVYGASDDLIEFDGAIYDEMDCYEGGKALLDAGGLLRNWESVKEDGTEAEIADYLARKKTARSIEAVWSPAEPEGASWAYKTEIPHSTFDVMEDGEIYCRGIVFNITDLA